MESKELTEKLVLNNSIHWKKFWKEQFFLCILALFSFVVYLIIYFILSDIVYLYLSLLCPAGILLWIGGASLVWYLKNKKKVEEK